ncbi:MAG: hypothetical protein WA741_29120 [Candidatus Sulfotelmatobacter sp.]
MRKNLGGGFPKAVPKHGLRNLFERIRCFYPMPNLRRGERIKGDRSGTVFQPIYETACGMDEDRAGMCYGNVWKKVIIERPELWIGIRSDPTFPQRAISLGGKTYFLDRS